MNIARQFWELTPTLRRVFDFDVTTPDIRAAYHVGGVNPYLLLGQVPLRHRCEPWGDLRCAVRKNGELLIPLSRPALEEGDFLDFFIYPPDPLEDVEEEALSLMQTRSTSRSPRRTLPDSVSTDGTMLAHTFHLSREHRLVTLDLSQPLTYSSQIETVWRFPPHTCILALHEMPHPPTDLEDSGDIVFLLETTSARSRQALPDDQMIMADIIIVDQSRSSANTHIRRILWSRHFMARSTVLHLLSVHAYCASPAADCVLTINRVVWAESDSAIREIHHGDNSRSEFDVSL